MEHTCLVRSTDRFDGTEKHLSKNVREVLLLFLQMRAAIRQEGMILLGHIRVVGVPIHLEHVGHSKCFLAGLVIREQGIGFVP